MGFGFCGVFPHFSAGRGVLSPSRLTAAESDREGGGGKWHDLAKKVLFFVQSLPHELFIPLPRVFRVFIPRPNARQQEQGLADGKPKKIN